MRNTRLRTIADIASWQLCTGCGACAVACPADNITLVDMPELGIRPIVDSAKCQNCGE